MANDYNSGERVIKEEVIHTPKDRAEERLENQEKGVPTQEQRRERRIRRIHRILYFIVHVITIFITIRFFLVLLGSNPENAFASFIYGLTSPFLAPFLGLFGGTPPPTYNQNVFEAADLVAIGIYYLFAWIGARLVVLANPRPKSEESH
jgi:hypothetical protein